MTRWQVTSMNLIVHDVAAATQFLDGLGVALVPVPDDWLDWAPHHRTFEVTSPADTDLDGRAFANWWGGVQPDDPQIVVNVGLDSRERVDELHAAALKLGATERRSPFDAFWGARYSVVATPGPMLIGFMSPPDDDRRTDPPSIDSLS